MKTLYQYTIKTDGKETIITELGGKTPLVMLYTDASSRPARYKAKNRFFMGASSVFV